jgi:hypothetical protein
MGKSKHFRSISEFFQWTSRLFIFVFFFFFLIYNSSKVYISVLTIKFNPFKTGIFYFHFKQHKSRLFCMKKKIYNNIIFYRFIMKWNIATTMKILLLLLNQFHIKVTNKEYLFFFFLFGSQTALKGDANNNNKEMTEKKINLTIIKSIVWGAK